MSNFDMIQTHLHPNLRKNKDAIEVKVNNELTVLIYLTDDGYKIEALDNNKTLITDSTVVM